MNVCEELFMDETLKIVKTYFFLRQLRKSKASRFLKMNFSQAYRSVLENNCALIMKFSNNIFFATT